MNALCVSNKKKDWIYQEPFLTEINFRIGTLKKEKYSKKLIEWKPELQNNISIYELPQGFNQ